MKNEHFFEKRCNKWEENKVEEEKQFYTFEEKDNFYEKIYNEFVEENPRFKL